MLLETDLISEIVRRERASLFDDWVSQDDKDAQATIHAQAQALTLLPAIVHNFCRELINE